MFLIYSFFKQAAALVRHKAEQKISKINLPTFWKKEEIKAALKKCICDILICIIKINYLQQNDWPVFSKMTDLQ